MTKDEIRFSRNLAAKIIRTCNKKYIPKGLFMKRAGLNKKYLQRLERGQINPEFHTLMKIAYAINIKVSKLLLIDFEVEEVVIPRFAPPEYTSLKERERRDKIRGF